MMIHYVMFVIFEPSIMRHFAKGIVTYMPHCAKSVFRLNINSLHCAMMVLYKNSMSIDGKVMTYLRQSADFQGFHPSHAICNLNVLYCKYMRYK